jgi:hypothetical protein
MSNPYIQIYNSQVGSGLAAYQGVRYQRGHGFFGRLIAGIGNFIKDLAPGLLKRTLPSALNLTQDIIDGQNVGKAMKSRLLEAGKVAADETLDKLKSRLQKGSGRRRHIPYKRRRKNKNLFR